VEDNKFLSDALTKKISLSGYEVKLVSDGADALHVIRSFSPDLILLDIVLPHKDGYQILEEIMADRTLKTIPVIVISNSGEPVEISRIVKLGVRDYIVKAQFNLDEVVQKIRDQLSINRESQRETDPILKGKHILWVEDDDFLSHIVRKKFSLLKCVLDQVPNAEEALKYLLENKPDIIVLDILMPGMNGYEVLENIRANPATKNIPVVVLSNMGEKADADKAMAAGADGFIVKAVMVIDDVVRYISKTLRDKKEKV